MQFLQTIDVGEAAPKPRRKRKSHWRAKWITLTKGARLDAQAIKQTMCCPKLLSAAMPRVILKEEFLQRPASWTKFTPPSERVELANFIGQATAAGIDADVAEKEFFRVKRAEHNRKKWDKYDFYMSGNSTDVFRLKS